MAETPLINMTSNLPKTHCLNPEAHQSRQLLLRRSSDEEDEEDEEETDIAEEHQKNDEMDVHEEDHNHDTPMIESTHDYLNHSISAPAFASVQRVSFPSNGNCDSNSNFTAITPKSTPTRQNSEPIFAPNQQAIAPYEQTNETDLHLTTTDTTNEYYDYGYSEVNTDLLKFHPKSHLFL